MPIKKYIAEKDTTITDAFYPNLIVRATNANMGASDILEVFSIFGQASTSSVERSRALVSFPIADIINDRQISKVPQSGSVKFYLRLFNAAHGFSLPKDFTVEVSPIYTPWEEGYGMDMETYSDYGWNSSNINGQGSTWIYSSSGSLWEYEGGDYYTGSSQVLTASFKQGNEDIELDVTDAVEQWISGSTQNNGFLIKLSGSFEDGTQGRSFYTKRFFGRSSQNFYTKPTVEARWEAIVVDDRNNFYASSSALSANDNTMNIFYYNKVNGKLKNIVGNILPNVKFYSNNALTNEITASSVNVTNPEAGIYKASVSLDTTSSVVYDRWYNTSSLVTYFSSSFDVYSRYGQDSNQESEYIININNLKNLYSPTETARFKIFAREKDWSPTIYSVAYSTVENTIISDLYYKIFRLDDNYVVIDYSTGSLAYSKTSYDSNGNYFDLDMSIIEKHYVYGIKLARWDGSELKELPTIFKFKVE